MLTTDLTLDLCTKNNLFDDRLFLIKKNSITTNTIESKNESALPSIHEQTD